MKRYATLAAAVVIIGGAAASCGDQPTAPSGDLSQRAAPADASAQAAPGQGKEKGKGKGKGHGNGIMKHADERAALLTAVPVTGALSDGGTFAGTFTATHISIDPATRALTMTGTLTGTATTVAGNVVRIAQQFSAPMALAHTASQSGIFRTASMATCDVLFLNLGPLHLDLLGLTVDLNQVVLDVNAVSGAGNLLGNLLCAVTGLLDGFGLLAAITQLLDAINNILAGLSPGGATGAALVTPGLLMHAPAYIIRS
ncbi:MAG TPA: hypothetical protein VFN39_07235 [Gemmatimonadaceae bacterium]|nr:hypothetical protein [Gemmatimonadaceae bacterium]